jgi:hypothetical protein
LATDPPGILIKLDVVAVEEGLAAFALSVMRERID